MAVIRSSTSQDGMKFTRENCLIHAVHVNDREDNSFGSESVRHLVSAEERLAHKSVDFIK